MDRKKFRYIKWLTVLVPALAVALYETVRHSLFDLGGIFGGVGSEVGNLITAGLVLIPSLVFGQIVFGWIEQTQARLAAQNLKLKALNRRVQHSAVLEERGRLSREMHDGVAQLLAYVMVKVGTVEGLLQAGRVAEARRELEEVRRACNEAYSEVREDIGGLRTDLLLLEDRGLATVLHEVLERFGDEQGCEVRFECDAQAEEIGRIEPVAEVQLVRVAQEALSNIRKHTSASLVSLTLRFQSGPGVEPVSLITNASWLVLEVQDDGAGFDPNQPFPGHFGLSTMRERIESLGGRLELVSAPACGTLVRALIPGVAPAPAPEEGFEPIGIGAPN